MAEVTTSGKVIQKPELVLELDDFLPPGLVGVRNRTLEETDLTGKGQGSDATGTVFDDEELDNDDPNTPGGTWLYDTLPVPTDMRIVEQVIRVGADKKITVDVVIETSDFPGITEFEARIIKDA